MTFSDVKYLAANIIDHLEKEGETYIHAARTILKLIQAISSRDMIGIMTQINSLQVDVKKLVVAIKEEFGL